MRGSSRDTRLSDTLFAIVFAALAGCGGGDDAPPASAVIGPAGGTLTGPSGSKVVVPAGALAADTTIGIAQSSAGAPALPDGITAFGPIFAFTPHGTTFQLPVTITVVFDPASVPAGTSPTLYKTDATQSVWEVVPGATVNGGSMSGPVMGFSYTMVARPPTSTLPVVVTHSWDFTGETAGRFEAILKPAQNTGSAPVDDSVDLGSIFLVPPGEPLVAKAEVHATENGVTYWTSAISPQGDLLNPDSLTTVQAHLEQTQYFQKTDALASLNIVVTQDELETIDSQTNPITYTECPWQDPQYADRGCSQVILTYNQMDVHAWFEREIPHPDPDGPRTIRIQLGNWDALTNLRGLNNLWTFNSYAHDKDQNTVAFLSPSHFDVDKSVENSKGKHARARLKTRDTLSIPLDAVNTGELVILNVDMTSYAGRRRLPETYSAARFRDPQHTEGLQVEYTGMVQVAGPTTVQIPPAQPPTPAPDCPTGTDSAAGQLQFGEASIIENEWSPGFALVPVTRTGGGKGLVSAAVSTRDDTAHAGVDYQALSTLVRFADGEEGTHLVKVSLIDNRLVDGSRTAQLVLSDPRGCAALGTQTTATLVILDDEQPIPGMSTYSLGGTVGGLVGTGLVLRDMLGGGTVTPGNGAFTFPVARPNGSDYDVRVETQPTNPIQLCTVANGSGVVADADVTNIDVSCVTPIPNGALDPAFGVDGKVSNGLSPAKALVLQADGKLLVLGGMTLSRYNADGSADASFGNGGNVTIVANGGGLDAMQGLALQSGGKIVVAGYTAFPTAFQDDIVVLRYDADGSLDTGFGVGGKVVTDVVGNTDRAYAVLVQGDDKILATGIATLGSGVSLDQDVALVRYLPDGGLDMSFGSGGKVTTNVAGGDFGYAAALQPDGKIVVGGRVAAGGGNPDFGVARYLPNGSLDSTFGNAGTQRIDFDAGNWDEAADLAIQGDGKIVVGGLAQVGATFRYALTRLGADGILDDSFGTAGRVSTDFSGKNDYGRALALQANGGIVVVGQVSSLQNGDFGIARYLADGTRDASFGQAGLVQVDFFGAMDAAFDVVLQADGKLVVAGSARNGSTSGIGIVRVLP